MKKEESLHIAVCRYLKTQYPNIIFNTDLSGIRLTQGQAGKVKRMRSSNAFPDIVIYEPHGDYAGLFIELKSRDAKLKRKDGFLCKDPHLEEQNKMLNGLEARGFLARFSKGFDQTIALIEWYLSLDLKEFGMDNDCPAPKLYPYEELEK